MTRLTAFIIADDPDVYATSFGPVDGKFGVYIGTWDETPSGHKRPRALLTGEAVYATAQDAQAASVATLNSIRESLKAA